MFCWTMMRKPKGRPAAALQVPRIEFHARADNAAIKEIPTGGDDAWLALVVSGLDRELVDANNVTVGINDRATTPRYVGRVRPHFERALAVHSLMPLDSLIYIETPTPAGTKSGKARVRVTYATDLTSPDSEIELVEAQPATPKIVTVRNGYDYQTDIYAGGPKSLLRLFVEGLDESATCDNVKIKVGEWLISPTFVGFVTDIAGYQVDAQLPGPIAPGATTIELLFRGVASEAVAVELKG
jgi:hypothetical protein